MRGAAMKVGQTLSAVDLGLVPEEIRPRVPGDPRDAPADAEPVSFKAITQGDRGGPGGEAAANRSPTSSRSRSPRPRSARSTARRSRRRARGRGQGPVPGDRRGDPRRHAEPAARAEAAERDRAGDRHRRDRRGDPRADQPRSSTTSSRRPTSARWRARIPRAPPVHRRAGRRHLAVPRARDRRPSTSTADRFGEVRDRPPRSATGSGEILIRFYINGPLRHRLLNGDPHPGNSLFLRRRPGRVPRLRVLQDDCPTREVAQLIASTRATYESDAQALFEVIAELGTLPDDPALAQPFLENYQAIFGWLLVDERGHGRRLGDRGDDALVHADAQLGRVRLAEAAGRALRADARRDAADRAARPAAARPARWLDVAREWLLGEDPATELGRIEAEFFAIRPYHGPAAPA